MRANAPTRSSNFGAAAAQYTVSIPAESGGGRRALCAASPRSLLLHFGLRSAGIHLVLRLGDIAPRDWRLRMLVAPRGCGAVTAVGLGEERCSVERSIFHSVFQAFDFSSPVPITDRCHCSGMTCKTHWLFVMQPVDYFFAALFACAIDFEAHVLLCQAHVWKTIASGLSCPLPRVLNVKVMRCEWPAHDTRCAALNGLW